jgi:hypothetical protein
MFASPHSGYCARYTGFYKRLQANPAPPTVYQPANAARIIRSWGKPLAAGRHAAKSAGAIGASPRPPPTSAQKPFA